MGVINFDPDSVTSTASMAAVPISRLAALAGGHGEIQNRQVRKSANITVAKSGNSGGAPANPANLLNSSAPAEWLEGFGSLDPNIAPLGFPAKWWRETIRDGELFLAKWARQAAHLGWTAFDVFGAHQTAPAANYAAMGLVLLIRGGRVVAISAETAIIEQASGSRLTFTRRPPEREAVLLWDLKGV